MSTFITLLPNAVETLKNETGISALFTEIDFTSLMGCGNVKVNQGIGAPETICE